MFKPNAHVFPLCCTDHWQWVWPLSRPLRSWAQWPYKHTDQHLLDLLTSGKAGYYYSIPGWDRRERVRQRKRDRPKVNSITLMHIDFIDAHSFRKWAPICVYLRNEGNNCKCNRKETCFRKDAHHAWTLFSPGECERRISCPLAVKSDIWIHIHCYWFGLYHQDRTNCILKNKQRKGSSLVLYDGVSEKNGVDKL